MALDNKLFDKLCLSYYYDVFYVFWGADFKNGIKNFVMSMILPLFKIL